MIDNFFYDTLKKFFKTQGITQQQIGDALGTTQVYVNSILNGRAQIGKSTAKKFHDLYGLSVAWLLTGEGEMMATNNATTINIGRDSIKVGRDANGTSIQQGAGLAEVVEKLVNELAEQRRASNKQQELINTLIEKLITDKKT
jgi:transcriptional regulator with XRE-family HTH domain